LLQNLRTLCCCVVYIRNGPTQAAPMTSQVSLSGRGTDMVGNLLEGSHERLS
jgi:hypothetical protein